MIPTRYITQWRAYAPWLFERQIEQDLIISRALVELFNDPLIAESIAFRGGTALYKLFVNNPARYSEDIDLVQLRVEFLVSHIAIYHLAHLNIQEEIHQLAFATF